MTRTLRSLTGLALSGYGLLVLLRVLAHDAFWVGIAALVIGVALLLSTQLPSIEIRRSGIVLALGLAAVTGVIGYNIIFSSTLSPPEWGILAYGAALIAASRYLGRSIGKVKVSTLVGWSFPLLFAPLVLFAFDAIVSGPAGGSTGAFFDPIIHYLLVQPMAWGLTLLGIPSTVIQNNIILQTERGSLVLGVGLVCAGLYPMVLFMGVLGLHAWRTGLSRRLFTVYMTIGLVSLYLLNLVRLMILALVGREWGGAVLQNVHAHLGWLLFALFMVAFWLGVVRRFEKPEPTAVPA
jgi:exosortase/archaeosortase family protein